MSVSRLLRFALGVIIAAVILAIILPFVGVPSSHYLPPAIVFAKAQGSARGFVTGKYYADTGNPFKVGAEDYFLDYSFYAPAPGPRGGVPGPKQLYTGTIRVDQPTYDSIKSGNQQLSQQAAGNQVIPLPHDPIGVTYEATDPNINGVSAAWAQKYQMQVFQNGRSIGPGSNTYSGWIIWVVVAIILGYFVAIGLANVMKSEDI